MREGGSEGKSETSGDTLEAVEEELAVSFGMMTARETPSPSLASFQGEGEGEG